MTNVLEQQLDDFRRTDDGSIIQGAAHTSRILNHKYRNKIIINAYTKLNKLDIYYDAIACCGTSGLMVVPQIAELLKKNIIVVRKQKDGYSDFMVEGTHTNHYIIIDDLICSGGTIKHIIKNIKAETPRSKCVGVYCYMPEESVYRNCPQYCKRDLGVEYL
jgi:adenine/guanine phosphoribosyltransferase-like PRPP-binding protein